MLHGSEFCAGGTTIKVRSQLQEVKVVLAHTVIIECAIRICAILIIFNLIRIVHEDKSDDWLLLKCQD